MLYYVTYNVRFTIEVLTRDFKSNDLRLSAKNLRKDRDKPTDILDRIDMTRVNDTLKSFDCSLQLVSSIWWFLIRKRGIAKSMRLSIVWKLFRSSASIYWMKRNVKIQSLDTVRLKENM